MSDINNDIMDLDRQKLDLERYKAKLDYQKFVLGSVFVAVAIAAIPPLFQFATSFLEATKADAERQTKQQEFRDDYVKDFIDNALNQDIELRIRFAQYFAFVSTDPFRQGWTNYHDQLLQKRDNVRKTIDQMESEWEKQVRAEPLNESEINRLERNLDWTYKEVGYLERNRSATKNPRTPTLAQNAPPHDAHFQYSNYNVFVRFAGAIKREDVKIMMEELSEGGWKVRGIDVGGERTASAAGYSEVRYPDDSDELAAQSLAEAVQADLRVARQVVAKGNSKIPKGNLEIWISR